jgi:release factor glutamine methyltransferase
VATIGTLLADAAESLRKAGIDQPRLEARLLLAHAFGMDQAALLSARERYADPAMLIPILERRLAREPLALIVGRQGFWTLDLAVSSATLIPRADTETLIEAALAAFPRREDVRSVLDLGTGTGALLLAALTEFPQAWGVGIDANPAAAGLAAANAESAGLAARAAFFAGDWAAACVGGFDLILSNPPYIPSAQIAGLMPEVARYEPVAALDGGEDGLSAYKCILPQILRLLRPGGAAVLELGQGQEADVGRLACMAGLEVQSARHDLSGIARALVVRPPATSGCGPSVLDAVPDEKTFGGGERGG